MRVNKTIYILMVVQFLSNGSFAQEAKKDGTINLRITANDSMHVATAIITDAADKKPLKGVELTFFVKRTFGLMKVGGGKTDSSGIVSSEIPLNIPGSDAARNVVIIAKVEDSDVMNDAISQAVTKSPVFFPEDKPLPRAMISPRAPWWLVFTFSLAVGSVWFLFAYIVFLMRRIKKAAIIKIIS